MTTPAEIGAWFDRGVADGASFMLVVCDTYDHEDFPVYVKPDQDVREIAKPYEQGANMAKLMEVYKLDPKLKAKQMSEPRAFHYE